MIGNTSNRRLSKDLALQLTTSHLTLALLLVSVAGSDNCPSLQRPSGDSASELQEHYTGAASMLRTNDVRHN
jgi:hypothetical protein